MISLTSLEVARILMFVKLCVLPIFVSVWLVVVEFPTVPFHDYGDEPGLAETAIHHRPLQYKGSSYCVIAWGDYCVCCAVTSRLSEKECGFLMSQHLPCDVKIKLWGVCLGFFPPSLVMMDELSFRLQFNWFRSLEPKLSSLHRKENNLKCSHLVDEVWGWEEHK